MASYKRNEFVNFCLTGKTQKYGSLHMKGSEVFSYSLKIAEVDRANKHITRISNPSRSKTTTMHVGSCDADYLFPNGWTFSVVENLPSK